MYEYAATVRRVIDGDTVDVDIDLGCSIHHHVRVRLYGINAPETHGVKKTSEEYKRGTAATEFLRKQVEGSELVIHTHKDRKGKYGRYLAELWVPGEEKSINSLMVEEGHAVEYFGGKR